MYKFLTIINLLLALCASVAGAQTSITNWSYPDQHVVFGSQNVQHGAIQIVTGAEKFSVPSLSFKVRECSTWSAAAAPFYLFTLTRESTVYPGIESWVDQERVVTFRVGGTQGPNTISTYSLQSDVVDYRNAHPLQKQCFRMTLERSGLPSKEVVVGNFPIRLGAKTLVRSKPTVTLIPIGPTTNRVRTVVDDVFLLTVSADTGYEILIKEIAPYVFGFAANGGGYLELVDHNTGSTIGIGVVGGQGNISFQFMGVPTFGEYFVSPGVTRSFRIRVNSSLFPNNPGQESLSLQLPNPCDFQWDTDFGNSGGPGLCLEPQVIPMTATVSYE